MLGPKNNMFEGWKQAAGSVLGPNNNICKGLAKEEETVLRPKKKMCEVWKQAAGIVLDPKSNMCEGPAQEEETAFGLKNKVSEGKPSGIELGLKNMRAGIAKVDFLEGKKKVFLKG